MPFREGEYQGNWIRVSILDDRVAQLYIIYSGRTLDEQNIIAQDVTLADAIKAHSLKRGSGSPPIRLRP